ncbi:MAG: hypothetical protein QOF28_2280 [Actinomycetota bacterium]|jgi:hypothetical protein|nr:hypothetical protein [Actinomycetota bacterium]
MGQTITVTSRQGSRPEVRFFDTNRSLTGMAIERYASLEDVHWQRPPDVLAKRLFELGAKAVTIYSNVVTVEAPVEAWPVLEGQIEHIIEHLFHYYGDDAGWSPAALGGDTGDAPGAEPSTEPSSAIPPV